MKARNTALFLILWFVCQQAGAVVSGIHLANTLTSGTATSYNCHDNEEQPEKDLITKNTAIATEHCDIGCECCLSGCQPVLGNTFNPTTNISAPHPITLYSFILSTSPTSSPFRPPIIF